MKKSINSNLNSKLTFTILLILFIIINNPLVVNGSEPEELIDNSTDFGFKEGTLKGAGLGLREVRNDIIEITFKDSNSKLNLNGKIFENIEPTFK